MLDVGMLVMIMLTLAMAAGAQVTGRLFAPPSAYLQQMPCHSFGDLHGWLPRPAIYCPTAGSSMSWKATIRGCCKTQRTAVHAAAAHYIYRTPMSMECWGCWRANALDLTCGRWS